ncbi:MAG: NAD(P)H-dependent oxidoreductase, partial [Micrococcaceae bacterium]|nr:NAD(P)H-dependent oxidoreductase [Micrococcaceae bacterium]
MSQDIVVISGGLGTPSTSGLLGQQLGESAIRGLASLGVPGELKVVELRDYAKDITNHLLSGYATPRLAQVIETVTGAAGLVMVTPVFTASVSGLFKSFIDVLDPTSLEDKPMVLAATGGSPRHSMVIDYAMRPIFAYLRARVMPTSVFASPEDWGADRGQGALAERERRAGEELARVIAGDHGSAVLSRGPGEPRSVTPRVSERANPRDGMTSLP